MGVACGGGGGFVRRAGGWYGVEGVDGGDDTGCCAVGVRFDCDVLCSGGVGGSSLIGG